MTMYRFFNDELFNSKIEAKDYSALRSLTVSVLREDPTFSTGEYEKVSSIIKKKTPDIYVAYKKQPGEDAFKEDKAEWNDRYYGDLTFWFLRNFAEERIDNIKKVGCHAYKKLEKTESNFTEAPKRNWSAPKKVTSPRRLLTTIAAIAAAIAVFILLAKLLSR